MQKATWGLLLVSVVSLPTLIAFQNCSGTSFVGGVTSSAASSSTSTTSGPSPADVFTTAVLNCSNNQVLTLTSDIDFQNRTLTPFTLSHCILDGQNHVIKNFNIATNDPNSYMLGDSGLFASIQYSTVMNLSVQNFTIQNQARYNAGALAGSVYGSNLINVSSSNGSIVSAGTMYTGGLVGSFCASVALRTSSSGVQMTVDGGNGFGGLIGGCGNGESYGIVTNSYTTDVEVVSPTETTPAKLMGSYGGGGTYTTVFNTYDLTQSSVNTSTWNFNTIWSAALSGNWPVLRQTLMNQQALQQVAFAVSPVGTKISQNQCLPTTLQLTNLQGVPVNAASALNFTVYANALPVFASQSDCTQNINPLSTVKIAAGSSSQGYFLRGPATAAAYPGIDGEIFAYSEGIIPLPLVLIEKFP